MFIGVKLRVQNIMSERYVVVITSGPAYSNVVGMTVGGGVVYQTLEQATDKVIYQSKDYIEYTFRAVKLSKAMCKRLRINNQTKLLDLL